ncbi:MAG: hypothetical protein KIG16_04180, partial [Eubacteriales bacterium]|nr:hypothetical protein [Eubacteriales bacterium]
GALFTAVYDVLYKYNSSNTTNLNAATVDQTGQTSWSVAGTKRVSEGETTTFNFDQGTYIMLFSGQNGLSNRSYAHGAICLAFYKGNSMTVAVGADAMSNGGSNMAGGGKTEVKTNFAPPTGYSGKLTAIAAGAGGGNYGNQISNGWFCGMEYSPQENTHPDLKTKFSDGGPGTWSHNGYRKDGVMTRTPLGGGGFGGAGYYDGGGGWNNNTSYRFGFGGGGSCTPWCYPVYTRDAWIHDGVLDYASDKYNEGVICFYKLDPTTMPTGETDTYGAESQYTTFLGSPVLINEGGVAQLKAGGFGAFNPKNILNSSIWSGNYDTSYRFFPSYYCDDIGIRTGWVYSVSEDGKSWHGVGPDDKLSASETQTSDTLVAE